MSEQTPETPRRLNAATVLQMLHDERMAQATKPSREDRPRITLKRSTASGSLGVVGIDVDVPVCEEFPSSAEAQAEAMRLMDELAARYPMPDKAPPKTDAEQLAAATRRGAMAAKAKL